MTVENTATQLSAAELATYVVAPEPFWAACLMTGDDGYDRIEVAHLRGWSAVPAWGLDGWDLGGWPYVVVFHRQRDGRFELAENVEGDVAVWAFPSRELRDAATDRLAFDHWQHESEEWVEGVANVEEAPAHLRGPFTRARSAAEARV